MKTGLLIAGVTATGITFYDQAALWLDSNTSADLPFIWKGKVAEYLSELWLAIIGALLILFALFF